MKLSINIFLPSSHLIFPIYNIKQDNIVVRLAQVSSDDYDDEHGEDIDDNNDDD